MVYTSRYLGLIIKQVPSKGSTLDQLLGRTEKPSGSGLAAAGQEWSDRGAERSPKLNVLRDEASPILPPSAVICLKNGIELEFNQ